MSFPHDAMCWYVIVALPGHTHSFLWFLSQAGWGSTLIFSYIRRLGPFFFLGGGGSKFLNFNIFRVFRIFFFSFFFLGGGVLF